jgi:hypothetical protein
MVPGFETWKLGTARLVCDVNPAAATGKRRSVVCRVTGTARFAWTLIVCLLQDAARVFCPFSPSPFDFEGLATVFDYLSIHAGWVCIYGLTTTTRCRSEHPSIHLHLHVHDEAE